MAVRRFGRRGLAMQHPDWSGWEGSGRRYTVVLGTGPGEDPATIGFTWLGEAVSTTQAKALAKAEAARIWKVMLATAGKQNTPMPYAVVSIEKDDREFGHTIGIGQHAFAAVQAAKAGQRPEIDSHDAINAIRDAMECAYKRAVLPDHPFDIVMLLGDTEYDEKRKTIIPTHRVYVSWPPDGIESFPASGSLYVPAIVVAAIAMLRGGPWETQSIDTTHDSATIRAIHSQWMEKPIDKEVASVAKFLRLVGLDADARAFEKAYL